MSTFYRWVPSAHAETSLAAGLVSHNGSAMWVFGMDPGQTYRPAIRITRGSILIAYDFDAMATENITKRKLINFESTEFKGEAKHMDCVITKNNEVGAYGIGKQRQAPTNYHATTRYATKREIAKALKLNELEVGDAYRPPGGWPR